MVYLLKWWFPVAMLNNQMVDNWWYLSQEGHRILNVWRISQGNPPVFTKVYPVFNDMGGRLVERVAPDDDARHFLDDQIGHQKDPGDLWAKAKHWKILKSIGPWIWTASTSMTISILYTNNKYIVHMCIYTKQERDIKIWYIIICIYIYTYIYAQ